MRKSCECCKRYWTHLHGKVKCFFTHMDRTSSHSMVIPESFVNYFGWKLSGTIELEAPNGNVYDVGITERRNKTVLRSGWEAFVDANHIVERDSLMFRYHGNCRFKVVVFGASGCEKVVSCSARTQSNINDQEPSTNSTDISTSSSDGNTHSSARGRSDDCQSGSSGHCRKRARKDAIPSRSEDLSEDSPCEHESSESEDTKRIGITPDHDDTDPYMMSLGARLSQMQRKKVLKKVGAIASDLHIYVAVMTTTSVRAALTFATQYCDTYLRKGSRSLVFQAEGKSQQWHGELHDTNRALRIFGGWTSFARDNNLREGDICLFELMKNKVELKQKMMVYIIRRERC
ncbi:B3 domain-containing protein Os03g0619600-like [Triticum dicoccoides]|uniref:B3 domain-containing protein Os03g0619600-like n=1 Tax=Triticum dicoccoides TaxID=85692 RepID=UPI00189083CA|nr:B3 domain-containing protein Os03g0619600-like [Triticum dicoccoides]